MIGRARTRTGKTLAFGIPIMDKTIQYNKKHGRIITEGKGIPIQRYMSTLDRGVDVTVGTPDVLFICSKGGALNLSEVGDSDQKLAHGITPRQSDMTETNALATEVEYLLIYKFSYRGKRLSSPLEVPWSNERPLENKELNAIIGACMNNANGNNGNRGNYNNLVCKNCGLKGHTIERCFEIIGYPPSFKRNPNLKLANNFNNNRSNNVDNKETFMGNNEIKTSAGTLSFNNEQVLKLMSLLNDNSGSTTHASMAVVLEYYVSLLFVHKLIKDSKLSVSFDETKCFIQDLKKEKVPGTGSESVGLYMFDVDYDKFVVSNQMVKGDVKFYETVFLFKMSVDESVKEHTEVSTLNFFNHFESEPVSKTPLSLNDDEEGSPNKDGRVYQPVLGSTIEQPGHDGDHPVTLLDEQNTSKGNVGINQEVPVFQNDLPNVTEKVGPRRSQRPFKLPTRLNEFVLDDKVKYGLHRYANHSFLNLENYCFVSNLNKCNKPPSYEEAVKDVNWVNAMNEEMHALYENKTWTMIDLPYDKKPIGSKWVFKIKYKFNGEVERYKARLVAKGFSQKEGIYYEKTFSLVVKMSTVRGLINLAVQKDWKIYQMDVNNTFLYGDLNEEVYMFPPPGFFNNNESKVCKLEKSLYGLKQAPRQWNHKLSVAVLEASFTQCQNDHSLFIKNKETVSLYLLVYVDDLVITMAVNEPDEHEWSLVHKSDCLIIAFSDSDWAKCPVTRRSVLGYCVSINSNLVFWKSKRQATLSTSSAEAEYRSMASTTCEIIEKVSTGLIKTVKVDYNGNVPDIPTKALGSFQHSLLTKKLGMLNLFG
ncbi:ribonuclease H-like domain-containing protein [Tanacetum coccineum]